MNRIVLRESWSGKWLRQIKHLVSANSLKRARPHCTAGKLRSCAGVHECVTEGKKKNFLHTCKGVQMSSSDGVWESDITRNHSLFTINYVSIELIIHKKMFLVDDADSWPHNRIPCFKMTINKTYTESQLSHNKTFSKLFLGFCTLKPKISGTCASKPINLCQRSTCIPTPPPTVTHTQLMYTCPASNPLLVHLWLIDVPTCSRWTKYTRLVYVALHHRHITVGHKVQESGIYSTTGSIGSQWSVCIC